MSYPFDDIQLDRCCPHFLARIPRDFARRHALCAQIDSDDKHWLLISAATDGCVIHNVQTRLGHPYTVHTFHDSEALVTVLDRSYERSSTGTTAHAQHNPDEYEIPDGLDGEDVEALLDYSNKDLLSSSGKSPIVKLVDRIIFKGIQQRSSDIHIQPRPDGLIVRYRIDGVLGADSIFPMHIHQQLISRIKVMGRMDVAERLVPQDGRCSVRIGDRAIDLRISALPTADGERIVLRLLDTHNQLCDFLQLGMPDDVAQPFLRAARRTSGIVLVTGPTGSGKTTTLYSTLKELNAPERNIMTIEDPIEYELSGLGLPISQSQVNERKGVNFANGLRHILRQDPDIIMVGEIRDLETARTAIQSSLTGHLVFSTLHTNDASAAVTRLIDLGIEPYLVAASVTAVLAQRLVRTICPVCKETSTDATSCARCHGNGYSGRTGIFELLELTPIIADLITAHAPLSQIRTATQENGMRSLMQHGHLLIDEGITSHDEIERVLHA